MTAPARKSLFLLTTLTLLAIAFMSWLGFWQLQRLAWKEDLITTIDTRINRPPVMLEEINTRERAGEDIRYFRASASGAYDGGQELYLFTVTEQGPGWFVYSPFATDQGMLIVNRGFVSEQNRDPVSRPKVANVVQGPVTLTGLVRMSEQQERFVPDNELAGNNWYWRDLDAMAMALGLQPGEVLPFFLDLQTPVPQSGIPQPGLTRVKLTNNHLGYAITWFGLAATLVIIYLLFVRKMLARNDTD